MCSAKTRYTYNQGTAQMINSELSTMEANVYSNKTLVPVTYLGQIIKDNFAVFFKEFGRTTSLT
jgi:hypothetical protein